MSAPTADIVRQYLVNTGLVTNSMEYNQQVPFTQQPNDGTTVAYVSRLPDDPDQVVAVYDVAGLVFGRLQNTGEIMEHLAFKIIARSLWYAPGNQLIIAIANALDTFPARSSITLTNEGGSTIYKIQSIYRTTTISAIGEETGRRRSLFTVSGRMAMQAT